MSILQTSLLSGSTWQPPKGSGSFRRQISPNEEGPNESVLQRVKELVNWTDREFDLLPEKAELHFLEKIAGMNPSASASDLQPSLSSVKPVAVVTPKPVARTLVAVPGSPPALVLNGRPSLSSEKAAQGNVMTPPRESSPIEKKLEELTGRSRRRNRRGFFRTGGSTPQKPRAEKSRKNQVVGMPQQLQAGTSVITSFPIQRSPRNAGGQAFKDSFFGVAGRPRSPNVGKQGSSAVVMNDDDLQQEVSSAAFLMSEFGSYTSRDHQLPPKPWRRWQAQNRATPSPSVQSASPYLSEADAVRQDRKALFAETNKCLMGGVYAVDRLR